MNSLKAGITAVAAACALAAASLSFADHGDDADFPEGYRLWPHVKSMIIEEGLPVLGDPTNPFNVIGIHHIYANKKALRGYEELNTARPGSVTFKDGSVIVFDLLNHVPIPSADNRLAVVEGERKLVAVMEKDARRYAATGGWLFQAYVDREPLLDKATQANVCFNCHKNGDPALPIIGNAAKSDFVFSRLRK
jgi:hypothetical protein